MARLTGDLAIGTKYHTEWYVKTERKRELGKPFLSEGVLNVKQN